MTKDHIIVNAEVGLSKRLAAAGLCYRAHYRASRGGWAGRPYNLQGQTRFCRGQAQAKD